MSATTSTNTRRQKFEAAFYKYLGFHWPGFLYVFMWGGTILILFALTVQQLIPLVDEYQNRNFAVKVDVVPGDDTSVERPQLTVCIPYYSSSLDRIVAWLHDQKTKHLGTRDPSISWISHQEVEMRRSKNKSCIECEALKNHSWDFWNDPVYGVIRNDSAFFGTTDYVVRKILNQSSDFGVLKLNETGFNWNQPLMDAVWSYLGCLLHETKTALLSKPLSYCYSVFNDGPIKLSDEKKDQLFQILTDSIDRYFRHSITFANETQKRSVWNEAGLIILPDKFCFPLNTNATSETFYYNFSQGDYDWISDKLKVRILTVAAVYEDPDHFYDEEYPAKSLFEYTSGQILGQAVSVFTYAVESKVADIRDHPDCFMDERQTMICLMESQAQVAIEHCHCVPFLFRYVEDRGPTHKALPYCNVTSYTDECRTHLQQSFGDRQKKCNNKCNHTFYGRWNQRADELVSENISDGLTVKIRPESTRFIQFTVTEKNSPQEFASMIGGLVNLYLGASGLTACASVLLCIDLIKRWRRLRNEGAVPQNSEGPHARWNFWWLSTIFMLQNKKSDAASSSSSGKQEDSQESHKQCRKASEEMKDEIKLLKKEVEKIQAMEKELRDLKSVLQDLQRSVRPRKP